MRRAVKDTFILFACVGFYAKFWAMAEIVDFVNRGAAGITPAVVDKLLRHLPQWKLEFTQIYEPLFPHLVDQLEFLADAVEDTAEGIAGGIAQIVTADPTTLAEWGRAARAWAEANTWDVRAARVLELLDLPADAPGARQ